MKFKFSGRIEFGSVRHSLKSEVVPERVIAPAYAYDAWTNQSDIPQYAPTIVGNATKYNPAGDCNGAFMSCNYQPNNNCYAYACCIATNTFPQPGRATKGSFNLSQAGNFTAANVQANAIKDGLVLVGKALADIKTFQVNGAGHFAALLFSVPVNKIGGDENANWPGDYHWVRCDDTVNYSSWSQKDGGDQITNFDFAGDEITDPSQSNWTVNQGPIGGGDNNEFDAVYLFVSFMWVPQGKVSII